ncbi:MAG: hypothetical protein B7X99_19795 [Rhizobiales bacterium 17-65-6]|nr:MAG: hypothetical protein B7X99_19795 [Rhizobiales bacterium 17-65-6]
MPGWDCHGLPIEWKIEEENYRKKGKSKPDLTDSAGPRLKFVPAGDEADLRLAVLPDSPRPDAIWVLPGTGLAEAAGLAIENGIKTDEFGRTSDPHIWSAGDCASFPHKGGRWRLESVGNAIHQAETVAENIMGAGVVYEAQPWFWSDQYDCKLQIAGLNVGYDNIVTRGPDGDSISFWYFQGDALLAVDAMNDPRAYMVGKRLIENG